MSLAQNSIRKGVIMCCRNRCRRRDDEEVRGIQQIALRGPGCISGTGRCENVLGTGGRRRCEAVLAAAEDFCEEVFGDRGNTCCSRVMGTGGGRFRCSNSHVMGAGGERARCSNSNVMGAGSGWCGQVFGTGGGFLCNDNVAGAGGTRRRQCCCCPCLATPITVPR